MFEDLELPDLERKACARSPADRIAKRKGYRQVGIRVRLDKRRTVAANARAARSPRGVPRDAWPTRAPAAPEDAADAASRSTTTT